MTIRRPTLDWSGEEQRSTMSDICLSCHLDSVASIYIPTVSLERTVGVALGMGVGGISVISARRTAVFHHLPLSSLIIYIPSFQQFPRWLDGSGKNGVHQCWFSRVKLHDQTGQYKLQSHPHPWTDVCVLLLSETPLSHVHENAYCYGTGFESGAL
jgi:hypothetical protein